MPATKGSTGQGGVTPTYAAVLEQVRARQAKLAARLEAVFAPGVQERCSLELGCGHGHYLVAFAEAHPDAFCLGIDLVTKRIERAQAKVARRGLTNALFLKAETGEFFEALPARVRLERVFMLFPDPWPKKRHHRRRMLQYGLLETLAARMDPGAPFFFQTDHAGLWEWAMERFAEHPRWELTDDPDALWPLRTVSYFEEICGSGRRAVALRAG